MAGPVPLPEGLEHVRTTDDFTAGAVPPGLLRTHRVADGVWGRLVVRAGTVTLVFEDAPDDPVVLHAGQASAIPPTVPHHVEPAPDAVLAIEFHRSLRADLPRPGRESSGLTDE